MAKQNVQVFHSVRTKVTFLIGGTVSALTDVDRVHDRSLWPKPRTGYALTAGRRSTSSTSSDMIRSSWKSFGV